jgi:hypothetical protein
MRSGALPCPALPCPALPCLIVADLDYGWNGLYARAGNCGTAILLMYRYAETLGCDHATKYPSETRSPFIGGHAAIRTNKGLRLIISPWALTHTVRGGFSIKKYPLRHWVQTSSQKSLKTPFCSNSCSHIRM